MAAQLGPYALLEPLGEGGMGTVYRARDVRSGRLVALKVLQRNDQPDALARFEREMRVARSVAHPNVVPVLDAGVEGGRAFIAFEVVEGGDLRRILRQRGRLPWPEATRLGAAIAGALSAIHAKGIVHRDLKPENVLMTKEGRPAIGDFGLARSVAASSLTRTGDVLGTPAYMAPEQADGRRDVDARVDLYSLGVILHEALAGEKPFHGEGLALLKAQMFEAPRPLRTIGADVPADLEALVLALLAKDPEARPADAASVERALLAIGAGSGEAAPRSGGPSSRTLVAVGIALIVLAVLTGLLASRLAERPAAPPPSPPREERKPAPTGAPVLAASAPDPDTAPVPTRVPTQAGLLASEALALLERGDKHRAWSTVERAIATDARSPEALHARVKVGDARSDVNILTYVNELSRLVRELVLEALNADEPDRVLELTALYLDVVPDSGWAHTVRGEIHYRRGAFDAAIREFDSAIQYEATDVARSFPLLHRALALAAKGEYAQAVSDIETARRMGAERGPAGALDGIANRAASIARDRTVAEDAPNAVRMARVALVACSTNAGAIAVASSANALALARWRAAPSPAAASLYGELCPDFNSALLEAARFEDSERVMADFCVVHAQSAWAHSTHAVALLRLSRFEAAEKALDRALELDLGGEKWLAYARRGEARAGRGDTKGALEDDQRAIDLHPGDRTLVEQRRRHGGR